MAKTKPHQSINELIALDLVKLGKDTTIEPNVYFAYPPRIDEWEPVVIGKKCYVSAGTAINSGVQIAEHSSIENGVTIGRNVKIGRNCSIGPNVVLGEGVIIGDGNVVHASSSIIGRVTIGDRNVVGPFASIGAEPQHRKVTKSNGSINIGNHNVLREYITVHLPTGEKTRIGNSCYVMAYNHIPHDAQIGDNVTMANNCQIGGHTTILPYANLGLSCVLHQNLVMGAGCMLGIGSVVTKDVPPYVVFYAGSIKRINTIGLDRMGRTEAEIDDLEKWYMEHYEPNAISADLDISNDRSVDSQWWWPDMIAFFEASKRSKYGFKE